MPTISELTVVIDADTKGLDAGIKKAEKSVGGFGDSLTKGLGMGLGFGAVGVAVGAIGTAVGALKGSVVDLNGSLEQSQIAFTTMLGSGEKAESFLGDLQKFAAQTPFEFPDLVSASKRMLAFGFESKQVVPLLTAVGDAVAAVGGGADVIEGVTTAIGQMQAKGKVSAEEMGQLAERGIPAWDMLAKKLGVSVAEAMDMVSKGQVKAATFVEAFQEGSAARFGGMMAKQSQTWSGALSTITDSLSMATAKAFQPFFALISEGAIALAGFLQSDTFTAWASAAADAIVAVVAALRTFIDAGVALGAELAPAFDAITTAVSGLFEIWKGGDNFDAIERAYELLTDLFGPEIAGMISQFVSLGGQAFRELSSTILGLAGGIVSWFRENWPLIQQVVMMVLTGIARLWEEHGAAIETVVRSLWTILKTIVEVGLGNLGDFIRLTLQVLTGDWEGAWSTLGTMLERTVTGWVTIFEAAFDLIFAVVDDATGGMLTSVTTWMDDTVAAITGGWTDATQATDKGMRSILDPITSTWNTIKSTTETVYRAIVNVLVGIWDEIYDRVIRPKVDAISTAISTAWNAIKSTTETVMNAVLSFVRDTIFTPMQTAISTAINTARDAVTGAWEAIKTKATEVLGPVLMYVRDTIFEPIRAAVQNAMTGPTGVLTVFTNAVNGVKTVVDTTLETLKNAWVTAWSAIERAANSPKAALEEVRQLVERLVRVMPSWLIPHSPTPFQLGIEGIARAARAMDRAFGDMTNVDGWLRAAMHHVRVPESWLDPLRWIVQHESSGDPRAKNPNSTASGLFQMIDTTWAASRDRSLPNDVFDPILNAIGGIRYIIGRYGDPWSAVRFWQEHGHYALGGWAGLHGPELALLGERGPEYVVPNHLLRRGGAASPMETHRVDVMLGGQLAAELYVTGRETAIRYGRVPA